MKIVKRGNYSLSQRIPFSNHAATIARRRTCVSFAQKATTFFMGGLLEPCNILPGNCSAHGVNNSKRFGKCAFRLKKGAVVRKLLHHKVGKVPKNGCVRVVGWCGGGAPSILQQYASSCLASIITFHSNCTRKENMKVSTAAVFVHPPSAPPKSGKLFTVGGGVMRDCRFVSSLIPAVQS